MRKEIFRNETEGSTNLKRICAGDSEFRRNESDLLIGARTFANCLFGGELLYTFKSRSFEDDDDDDDWLRSLLNALKMWVKLKNIFATKNFEKKVKWYLLSIKNWKANFESNNDKNLK